MKKNLKKCLIIFSAAAMAVTCLAACTTEQDHKHAYSGAWSHDEEYHWHEATCEHEGEQGDRAKHKFTQEVTQDPTCVDEGEAIFTCQCGYSYTGTVAALGHDLITVPAVSVGCETDGVTEHQACSRCDWEGDYQIIIKTGVHNFATKTWAHDDATHWRPCLGGCERKESEAAHTLDEDDVCTVCGYEEVDTDFRFETVTGGYQVVALSKTGLALEEIVVPATYKEKAVVAIKANAFAGNTTVRTITLPASIAAIGDMAFEGCTSLEAINLGDTHITKLGRETFYGCTSLADIKIPTSVTEIGIAAFAGCTSLNITDGQLPSGLKTIGAYAFDGCSSLTDIALPGGLTSLGDQAFANSGLQAIAIPAGITKLNDNMFLNCSSLATVSLKTGLTSIGMQAFARCTSLETIDFPAGLTAIGQNAFKGSGLISVTVPQSVTSIGSFAFAECASLETAIVSANINYHFGGLFADCPALEELTVPFIGSHVDVSDAVTTEFGYLFGMSTPKTDANAFTKVGSYYIPNSLLKVTILKGTIAEHAFDGCTHLVTIRVSADVTLNATEFTDCTATVKSEAKVVSFIAPETAFAEDDVVQLSWEVARGNTVEVSVKKDGVAAVEDTDYMLDVDNKTIWFVTAGTFTITVKAISDGETDEMTKTIAVTLPGPSLTNVAIDKTDATTGTEGTSDTVTLTYTAGTGTTVTVKSVTKNDAAATEDTDYEYTDVDGKYLFEFKKGGRFVITLEGSRNGKTVERTVNVTVQNTNAAQPAVTVTATPTTVVENNAVTFDKSYTCEDAVESYSYAIRVQTDGSAFENAPDNTYEWIGEAGARTGFKPLIAGTYKIEVTATSVEGGVGTGEATVTVTAAEITLAWADGLEAQKTNGWLRMDLDGDDIAYTVTGYSFGYAATFTVDDAAASASAAQGSGTAVAVATTASNTVNVTVTYTHKVDNTKVQTITVPVSFVTDLANAPVLGEDPFGGTYGTLIPSTGLMLYFDAYEKDGTTKLAYDDVEYAITAETTGLGTAAVDGDADSVVIRKVDNRNDYTYLLAKNFGKNNANGTITVKLTVTQDGETAAATKIFTLESVAENKVNSYIKAVVGDSYGAEVSFIGNTTRRENMVVSKTGIIHHRNGGEANWNLGDILRVDINPENASNPVQNFRLDFKFTAIFGGSVSLQFGFRTVNWDNGWAANLDLKTAGDNIDSWAWLNGDNVGQNGAEGDLPSTAAGTSFYVRLMRTVDTNANTAKISILWSETGEEDSYLRMYDVTKELTTTAGQGGAFVHAFQIASKSNSNGFYIENMKVTNLDA